jgi:uncharacterized Ntn-hydrolase superfamily protein
VTFSITARCPRTGQLGVAVSTAVPGVGWWVPHVEPGVGAIASQALCNPYLGIVGLRLLRDGASAEATLEQVLRADPMRERRQLAVVDAQGRSAAFTGSETHPWQGHQTQADYAAAGNMLVGAEVVQALADVMQRTADLELEERLMQALEAAQKAGGDNRGRCSAAIRVFGAEHYAYLDARVDEHADPVPELRRLVEIARKRRSTAAYYTTRLEDMPELAALASGADGSKARPSGTRDRLTA